MLSHMSTCAVQANKLFASRGQISSARRIVPRACDGGVTGKLILDQRRLVSNKVSSYDDTICNLLINEDTQVLVQGFTGKQV